MGNSVDHIFVVSYPHEWVDIKHFYRGLNRRHKYLFADCPNGESPLCVNDLKRFVPRNSRAIFYLSHVADLDRICHLYPSYKTVRMYHGIVMPWANILRSKRRMDVAICASNLDAAVWKTHAPDQCCRVIGWPRGEQFMRGHQQSAGDASSICVNTNWSREKAAFGICDHTSDIPDLSVTVTKHPHLTHRLDSPRSVEEGYIKRQMSRMNGNVRVRECPNGVFPHFFDKSLLLSVLSSSAIEWLLLDRPILFLREHEALDYGPSIDERPLGVQIQQARQNESPIHREIRRFKRHELESHFGGSWKGRFHNLVGDLEWALAA